MIAGDQNVDPDDGDGIPGAIQQLLDHPDVNDGDTPSSAGGTEQAALQGGINATHTGDPAFDTADFSDLAPGNLRVDYVLPRRNLKITGSGVFWPLAHDPLFPLVGVFPFPGSDHRLVWADLVTVLEVAIDVRPESEKNPFNPASEKAIPVAILGSDSFDTSEVDVSTLGLGPDCASPMREPGARQWDVNGDGLEDLVSQYRPSETGIALGDEEVCLAGETLDGTPFVGCDTIRTTRGCGVGVELALLLPPLLGLRRRSSARSGSGASGLAARLRQPSRRRGVHKSCRPST